jgi:hypothetical protein
MYSCNICDAPLSFIWLMHAVVFHVADCDARWHLLLLLLLLLRRWARGMHCAPCDQPTASARCWLSVALIDPLLRGFDWQLRNISVSSSGGCGGGIDRRGTTHD